MKISFVPTVVYAAGIAALLSCNGENKPAAAEPTPSTVDVSAGAPVYQQNCAACHQANGEGITGTFPELKGADFLKGDKANIIKVSLHGSPTAITVNGTTYAGGMMNVNEISDKEAADVVNYILNSWGNNFGTVTESDVAAAR